MSAVQSVPPQKSVAPPPAAPAPVVLAIDDAEDMRQILGSTLAPQFTVRTAVDGPSGLKLAQETPHPDLVLLDVMMVGMDGYEVCKALKENPATSHIPVIFLSVLSEVSDEATGLRLGAVDYVAKPINAPLLKARIGAQLALARRRGELERAVRERTHQLDRAYHQLVQRLARVIEYHEGPAYKNQVLRVSQYVHLISHAARAKPAVIEMMVKAAPLYDIGKLAIPAEILRKPGELSDAEWKLVRRHPQIGAEIIGEHADPVLRLARVMALSHHERWDGAGYPGALRGEAIPWAGRVMAIVDAFENMTTTQYRRDPLAVEDAAGQLIKGSGSAFDPAVVAAFKAALPAMHKVRSKLPDSLGEILDLDFTAGAGA